jgi:hypothetical protein
MSLLRVLSDLVGSTASVGDDWFGRLSGSSQIHNNHNDIISNNRAGDLFAGGASVSADPLMTNSATIPTRTSHSSAFHQWFPDAGGSVSAGRKSSLTSNHHLSSTHSNDNQDAHNVNDTTTNNSHNTSHQTKTTSLLSTSFVEFGKPFVGAKASSTYQPDDNPGIFDAKYALAPGSGYWVRSGYY